MYEMVYSLSCFASCMCGTYTLTPLENLYNLYNKSARKSNPFALGNAGHADGIVCFNYARKCYS